MEILTKTTYLKKSLQLYLRSINLRVTKSQRTRTHWNTRQNDIGPNEAENVRVNTSLVKRSSFWVLLETYHHISIQLLSSVNPPVYVWRNSHQSVLKFKLSYGVI